MPEGREPTEEEVRLALTRRGKPTWSEEDFQGLIRQLQYAGYGWLRPEGVRVRLLRMARVWEGTAWDWRLVPQGEASPKGRRGR